MTSIPAGAISIERRHTLSFDPQVAAIIGIPDAIVLSELIWYTTSSRSQSGRVVDGERWIFNSYDEWTKVFPFWGAGNIKKIISRLEDQGLIKSRQDLNTLPFDRTKWYTVNLDNPAYRQYGDAISGIPVAAPSDTDVTAPTDTVVAVPTVTTAPDNTNRTTTNSTTDSFVSDSGESSTLAPHNLNTLPVSPVGIPAGEGTGELAPNKKAPNDQFETFWQAYPKTVAGRSIKKTAQQKFALALKKTSFENIMSALEWWKTTDKWKSAGGQYVDGAQKWLHQEMWLDAEESPVTPIPAPDPERQAKLEALASQPQISMLDTFIARKQAELEREAAYEAEHAYMD